MAVKDWKLPPAEIVPEEERIKESRAPKRVDADVLGWKVVAIAPRSQETPRAPIVPEVPSPISRMRRWVSEQGDLSPVATMQLKATPVRENRDLPKNIAGQYDPRTNQIDLAGIHNPNVLTHEFAHEYMKNAPVSKMLGGQDYSDMGSYEEVAVPAQRFLTDTVQISNYYPAMRDALDNWRNASTDLYDSELGGPAWQSPTVSTREIYARVPEFVDIGALPDWYRERYYPGWANENTMPREEIGRRRYMQQWPAPEGDSGAYSMRQWDRSRWRMPGPENYIWG